MILTYKNKPEIVCLRGYLRNFCRNFGKKRNFGQNLDFIEFRPKFRVEREFRPNRNRNQKSSFRFRSNRNRNTNLNFGFGFLLSKICFLCSLVRPLGSGANPNLEYLVLTYGRNRRTALASQLWQHEGCTVQYDAALQTLYSGSMASSCLIVILAKSPRK